MICPFCHAAETKVIDSRLVSGGNQIRRRRECIDCQGRFTTYETAELVLPRVIKRDGTSVQFDLEKLRKGIQVALEKRPVRQEAVEKAVHRILHKLRSSGDREVDSHVLGDLVMLELKTLDEIGYIRFASVYRHFQDVDEFRREIAKLKPKSEEAKPQKETTI